MGSMNFKLIEQAIKGLESGSIQLMLMNRAHGGGSPPLELVDEIKAAQPIIERLLAQERVDSAAIESLTVESFIRLRSRSLEAMGVRFDMPTYVKDSEAHRAYLAAVLGEGVSAVAGRHRPNDLLIFKGLTYARRVQLNQDQERLSYLGLRLHLWRLGWFELNVELMMLPIARQA